MNEFLTPSKLAEIIGRHSILLHEQFFMNDRNSQSGNSEKIFLIDEFTQEIQYTIASGICSEINTELVPLINEAYNYRMIPMELRAFLESDINNMVVLGKRLIERTGADYKLNAIKTMINEYYSDPDSDKTLLIESIKLIVDGK